ncbi:MAG: NAD(P)/FAD-dependent oxidoreductase [Candidatus Omnitrophica bacterium CG07_land_8_20_14_0_80_42_15]|uniref:NAD(P)/FAD-dependent oxidoreductase n=1 Tax=Candidatus Aquitaenariimonas noxiae TaxID=1974741 RepID=A0A2J0KU76_9BACT|nr:MAG: NAD(P)/FAD-dependent oxidoreductase [Candidatus Omnitrophica bacterium CG07_land_8_20_14_0_80_42_15]
MRYCIIGGSAAGTSACEMIRGIDKKADITLITDEKFALYSRCLLSYLLAGSINEDKLKFKEKDFFERNKIEALLGVRVEKIDSKKRELGLSNKKKVTFDRLLIATGARPKEMGIPGEDKKGVFALRTIEDARGILNRSNKGVKRVAILGGGLIGMRDAYALGHKGFDIKVIVKSGQILSQMMEKEGAEIIEAHIKKFGVDVMKGLAATEILGKDEVSGIILDNGNKLDCELVIVGKGVAPNIELAKDIGLATKEGIIADDYLAASQDGIWTAGDVCEAKDLVTGEKTVNALWPCAVEQGRVAALNMAGKKTKYEGSQSMNSLDLFGLSTISIGVTKPKGAGYEILTSKTENSYKRLVIKGDILWGMTLVGKVENAGVYGILIRNKINISDYKKILLRDDFNYAKILPLIKKEAQKFCKPEFQDILLTY